MKVLQPVASSKPYRAPGILVTETAFFKCPTNSCLGDASVRE